MAGVPRHWRIPVAVALLVAAGVGLSACGGSQALPLAASEHLGPTVPGRPGSDSWCKGVEQTADSLIGLGRGESLGIAARIVRNDVHRLASARARLADQSAASALQSATRAASQALTELRDGQDAGLTEAGRAAAAVTRALTRFKHAGAGC